MYSNTKESYTRQCHNTHTALAITYCQTGCRPNLWLVQDAGIWDTGRPLPEWSWGNTTQDILENSYPQILLNESRKLSIVVFLLQLFQVSPLRHKQNQVKNIYKYISSLTFPDMLEINISIIIYTIITIFIIITQGLHHPELADGLHGDHHHLSPIPIGPISEVQVAKFDTKSNQDGINSNLFSVQHFYLLF